MDVYDFLLLYKFDLEVIKNKRGHDLISYSEKNNGNKSFYIVHVWNKCSYKCFKLFTNVYLRFDAEYRQKDFQLLEKKNY